MYARRRRGGDKHGGFVFCGDWQSRAGLAGGGQYISGTRADVALRIFFLFPHVRAIRRRQPLDNALGV